MVDKAVEAVGLSTVGDVFTPLVHRNATLPETQEHISNDKAANNITFVCKKFYISKIHEELA